MKKIVWNKKVDKEKKSKIRKNKNDKIFDKIIRIRIRIWWMKIIVNFNEFYDIDQKLRENQLSINNINFKLYIMSNY